MNHPHNKIPRHPQQGFTLIELMIVVFIAILLLTIAVPSYRNYIIRSNRTAAEGALLQIANKEEQYALDARSYATTTAALNYATPNDVKANYLVTVNVDTTVNTPNYLITAAPQGSQVDPTCGTIGYDQTGTKYALCTGATTGTCTPPPASAACW